MAVKIDIENPRITFARVTINIGDTKEVLCKSISYGDSIESSDIEGNARMSLGRTDGQYKTDEGSVELYADEFAVLVEALGDKFYEQTFEISVAYEKLGESKLTADTLVSCRFTKRSSNDQSGSDGLTRSLSFKPMYIKWNGKNPLSKMPTGAA